MNPIARYLRDHGLTYQKVARMAGLNSPSSVRNHALGIKAVSPESAIKYEVALGIPRSVLRPDLWPPERPSGESPTPPIGAESENL